MPEQLLPKAPRHWLRLSVRGLMVLVLVTGAALGCMVRTARIQREAVAVITRADGSVRYDWELNNGTFIPGGKPRAPKWLVDLIGVDYFGHVTAVQLFSTSKATDAVLAQVGCLSRLEGLYDNSASVSDAGMVHLRGLSRLSILNLCNTQVTDAGLVNLKGLTRLSSMYLCNTQVSGAGLAHLKGLAKLSVLDLRGTRVTDSEPVHLVGLTKLGFLNLNKTQVTGGGVQELQRALPMLKISR